MAVRDERLAPWPRTESEIRRHLHEYYATITGLDFHIGRLLEVVREVGMAENTIIVFASDNGLSVGSHGLMGKQNVYEPGLKVPLISRAPASARGNPPPWSTCSTFFRPFVLLRVFAHPRGSTA